MTAQRYSDESAEHKSVLRHDNWHQDVAYNLVLKSWELNRHIIRHNRPYVLGPVSSVGTWLNTEELEISAICVPLRLSSLCEGVWIDSALFFLHTPIEEYDLHCFSMATFLFMGRFLRRSQGFLPRIRRFQKCKIFGGGGPL